MVHEVRASLDPRSLTLTRDDLDPQKLGSMISNLKSNTIEPWMLGEILVRMVPGIGYLVADGNHRTAALLQTQNYEVVATVYTITESSI